MAHIEDVHGVQIVTGTLEEILEFEAAAQQRAIDAILPSQAAIGWGDHWMQLAHDILIFGHIWTREEALASCRKAGGSEEECADEDQMLVSAHERGFRFGLAYSVVTPDGELGTTHVSVMVPISAEQFEEARSDGWLLDRIKQRPWLLERAFAIVEEAREQHG